MKKGPPLFPLIIVVSQCATAWCTLWLSMQEETPFPLRILIGTIGLVCFVQATHSYRSIFNP